MSETFDPYQQWLGIPPGEQPPHHYRLLGISLFEQNPTIIGSAADRLTAHLQTLRASQQTAESQRLLSEVLAARFCLLNPNSKSAYDQWLRQYLQPSSAAVDRCEDDSIDPGLAAVFEARIPSTSGISSKSRGKKSRSQPAASYAVSAITMMALGVLGLWWAIGHDNAPSDAGRGSAADPAKSPTPANEALPKSVQPSKETAMLATTGPKHKSNASDSKNARGSKPPKSEIVAEMKLLPEDDTTVAAQAATDGPSIETPEPTPARRLVPLSLAEQQRLMGEIDEVYKPGEAKDQAAKAALVRKLLEDGRKDEANPAEKFVLFRRAAELACDGYEVGLMLEAVDAISAAGFDIQPFQVKSRLLKRLVAQDASASAAQLSEVSASCVKFAEEEAAGGAVEEALDVLAAAQKSMAKPITQAQAALRAAKAAIARGRTPADKAGLEQKAGEAQGELDAVKSAQSALAECANRLQQARREREALLAAQEKLKTAPHDAAACLAVGSWYCFQQGDWDEGLKRLAMGSDPALKSLAAEELASKPAKAADKVARGDAWWNLAERAVGKAKVAMRRRAGQWYQAALPELAPGLAKSRLEKRLAQAADEPPSEAIGPVARIRPTLAADPFNEKTAK